MKRNGMCPFCYIKKLLTPASSFTEHFPIVPIDNGVGKTPLMGWSSWNTFRNNIDENLIADTADAMKRTGLLDAGYRYINIDDCWHSSLRDADGRMQGDFNRFPSGIPALVSRINEKGFKVGIYSSNGHLTCEDLPASLYREELDARTFAEWGMEYFKYDFCHHIYLPKYAPLVYSIELSKRGSGAVTEYLCEKATLTGLARYMTDKRVRGGMHVSGLDNNRGAMEYENVMAEEDGEYILTVNIKKKGSYEKFLTALINGEELVYYRIPAQKFFNYTSRFQMPVQLKKGANTVKLFNPIKKRSDSAFLQYYNMGKEIKRASEQSKFRRPILYSICEWGFNQPWKWGRYAGNMWRTTMDIRPWFFRIKMIYNRTVRLHQYASVGAFNDPDMLEVGNGKLTRTENIAHFSLWCMLSAPLVLGNDIRKINDDVLSIVTNKDMLAINQDPLAKQCKRIKKGRVDTLIKPLADGSTAICLFNKSRSGKRVTVDFHAALTDSYIGRSQAKEYRVKNVWEETEETVVGKNRYTLKGHSVVVLLVY